MLSNRCQTPYLRGRSLSTRRLDGNHRNKSLKNQKTEVNLTLEELEANMPRLTQCRCRATISTCYSLCLGTRPESEGTVQNWKNSEENHNGHGKIGFQLISPTIVVSHGLPVHEIPWISKHYLYCKQRKNSGKTHLKVFYKPYI